MLFLNNEMTIVASDREIYTASLFAKTSLLHLQEIGSLQALRPHVSSRQNLQSYLFFMVISGSGFLTYQGKKYELKESNCVFIDCREQYCHSTKDDDLWMLRWCHFNGPMMASVYDKYCERGGRPVFTINSKECFLSVLDEIMTTARSSEYVRDMFINEQLSILIRLIMEQSWHPENKALLKKRSLVLEVKKYLDEHYFEQIVLDNLASQFFISKYYLTHSFKKQFGVTINAYLQSLRITHAKRLLRFSTKKVENISIEVGISDPAYFSRLFKNVEGVSPSVYRTQW